MKYGDVRKLQESGFITDEQRQKIVERFNLKEDNTRFLVIISFVGAVLALVVFCLLQIQVGLQARSADLVNLGVVFIAPDIIAVYLGLFVTMAFTGLMFVVSGVFLIVFGVYLEKKRRAPMKQITSPPEGLRPEATQI